MSNIQLTHQKNTVASMQPTSPPTDLEQKLYTLQESLDDFSNTIYRLEGLLAKLDGPSSGESIEGAPKADIPDTLLYNFGSSLNRLGRLNGNLADLEYRLRQII